MEAENQMKFNTDEQYTILLLTLAEIKKLLEGKVRGYSRVGK